MNTHIFVIYNFEILKTVLKKYFLSVLKPYKLKWEENKKRENFSKRATTITCRKTKKYRRGEKVIAFDQILFHLNLNIN